MWTVELYSAGRRAAEGSGGIRTASSLSRRLRSVEMKKKWELGNPESGHDWDRGNPAGLESRRSNSTLLDPDHNVLRTKNITGLPASLTGEGAHSTRGDLTKVGVTASLHGPRIANPRHIHGSPGIEAGSGVASLDRRLHRTFALNETGIPPLLTPPTQHQAIGLERGQQNRGSSASS